MNFQNKLLSRLNSAFIKDTLKLSSSSVLTYLLPLVVTPILSRLYIPESFGEWGLFSSLLNIINIGIFFGYENAIVKSDNRKEVQNLVVLCFIIVSFVLIIVALIFLCGNYCGIPFFIGFPSYKLLILCLAVTAFQTILFNLGNWFERYSLLAFSSIVLGLGQAIFRIILGLIDIDSNGLIIGTIIGQTLAAISLLKLLGKNFLFKEGIHVSSVFLKQTALTFKNFPLYDAPASILAFAAFNLPIVVLSIYFSKAEIGCYSMVIQFLLMPISFVGSAMSRVYYRNLSSLNYNDSSHLRPVTIKVLKIVSLISVLPTIFLAFGGDKLLVLFLGEKWVTAGNIALCLAIWSFPTILTQPLLPLFRILNKQHSLFRYNLLYFILGIGSIIIFTKITSNLYFILLIYALFCAFAKLLLFKKILKLSQIRLSELDTKILAFWLVSIIALFIRCFIIFN